MTLCTRCETLFNECRPLLGAACAMQAKSIICEPSQSNDSPDVHLLPKAGAALIADHRTGRLCITPILLIDFYAGWP